MKPSWLWVGVVAFLCPMGYQIVSARLHSPDGKVRIAMAGRSTMQLWFKHWNWPYLLRIRTTYKPWPVPYDKYSREGIYLEYLPLDEPRSKNAVIPFGEDMLKSFENGLDRGRFDAAFFKFCFVDFPVETEHEREVRFRALTTTVARAYEAAARRGLKLIVGSALPLPNPTEQTLQLQRDYNTWLKGFEATHGDVRVFDLFSPLTDQQGRLRPELARDAEDHHPGDRAFAILDRAFFRETAAWFKNGPSPNPPAATSH